MGLVLGSASWPQRAGADEIRVAVASNFAQTLEALAVRFEAQTGHTVKLAVGSTGKHYAQIAHGAPFDVFFAADVQRAERLEDAGLAQPDTRFTYAIGRLALWSPAADGPDLDAGTLKRGDFSFLAIANPKLAPYGEAAESVLRASGVWDTHAKQIVRGEHIAQALHFVKSGSAELGLVAQSQVLQPGADLGGRYWVVPQEMHAPIEQQAVLLRDHDAARALLAFVRSEASLKLIREYGYDTPDAE